MISYCVDIDVDFDGSISEYYLYKHYARRGKETKAEFMLNNAFLHPDLIFMAVL